MSLGAEIVRHLNVVQHDDPEIACFLHALRAGMVIIYYKSSHFSINGVAFGASICFKVQGILTSTSAFRSKNKFS